MSEFKFVAAVGDPDGLLGTPVADFNKGGNVSDIVNMEEFEEVYFMLQFGARSGTSAAPVITVLACDDVSPSNATAVEFEYKKISSVETNTAWTAVTSSGYTLTTGDDQVIVIRAKAPHVGAVVGRSYVQVSMTEPADDPQVGACLIMLAKPRYDAAVMNEVTV